MPSVMQTNSKNLSSFTTGITIIISLHLASVHRSQCYLSEALINPECHVMSMSRVVADGTMSGTTIT